ncbi:hypothetical protein [Actinomadura parmotrematis]|uniref:Uncharacterized protein n=1 Tax=Actinomadura parmotrematis TaxID=2864039 RepID=A0ABS7FPI0_9ACTN|nr:hypothetical protein [Actinomadura parmotrematis]MBW8482125.1 hypothetical protein [Actinomadura parmotrematis]
MTKVGREIIEGCRDNLGPPPRAFDPRTARGLRSGVPLWLRLGGADALRQVIDAQDLLLAEGRAVWGCVVQAHAPLLHPGRRDLPAVVIYSPDAMFDDMPDELQDVAARLFAVRDTEPADPALRELARMLAERSRRRSVRLPLPRALVGSAPVYATTVLVVRRHLPRRRLSAGTFPLLTHPGTDATMIVPSRFWPDALHRLWQAAEE